METDVPASAQQLVDDWFAQPRQKVAVEINLRPGTVQHMLDRVVHEPLIGKYHGEDVCVGHSSVMRHSVVYLSFA